MELEKNVFQPSSKLLILYAPMFFFILIYLSNFFSKLLFSNPNTLPFMFLGFAILFFGALLWSYMGIKNIFIEIKEDGIQIRKGIIAKKQLLFLYSQIQDVKESQSFTSMILGLRNISIKTMTASSAFGGAITGLREEDANLIREIVLKRVNQKTIQIAKKKTPNLVDSGLLEEETQEDLKKNPWKNEFMKEFFIQALIAGIFLVVLPTVFFILISMPIFILMALMFFGFVTMSLLIKAVFAGISYRYFLGKTRIEIVQGIFSYHRNNVPFYKLQDIIIVRHFWSRFMKLANILIETGEINVVQNRNKGVIVYGNVVPSLNFEAALKLKDYIFGILKINIEQLEKPILHDFPLETLKVIKKTISGTIGLGILGAIGVLFLGIYLFLNKFNVPFSIDWVVLLVVLIGSLFAIFAFKIIHEYFYLKSYYYNISTDAIFIRKGVLTISEIIVPFKNIQNIFVDQDLMDHVFGLYDVHFSTVTKKSARMSHIDGVSKKNADNLKNLISKMISKKHETH